MSHRPVAGEAGSDASPDAPAGEDLRAAAELLLGQVEDALARKEEALATVAKAEARLRALDRSVSALACTMPQGPLRESIERRLSDVRLTDLRLTAFDGPAGSPMELLLGLLAHHPGPRVTSAHVRRHLAAHGAPADAGRVARMLCTKARQGVLERLCRGTYRIVKEHPMLIGRRP